MAARLTSSCLALALAIVLAFPSAALSEPLATDVVDGTVASQLSVPLASLPDVVMAAGALVDSDGRVLWSRNADEQRAMASITKIMTAAVALEIAPLDKVVTVPELSTQVGESSAGLRKGEQLSLHDLLAAMLVKSGNDAALAIAVGLAGSEDAFVKLMNDKASALGLQHTHFANVHGLDEEGHYSTAADLAVLARYAMGNPEFRQIVSMPSITIGTGADQETLKSTNLLLGNYAGAIGIKTGHTNDAGYSLVGAAERDGITLYAVVLGTGSDLKRFQMATALLEWGFIHYRPQKLADEGTVLARSTVLDYLDVSVPAAVSADTTIAVLDADGPITRSVTVSPVSAPVKKGDRVGVVSFTQAGKLVATVPLVATVDVARPNGLERVWIAVVRAWRAVFGSVALQDVSIFGYSVGLGTTAGSSVHSNR